MKEYIKIFIALISLLFSYFSEAQEATATLDSSNIVIGDQTFFHLNVNVPINSTIEWPFFDDTLTSHIEILNASPKNESVRDTIKTISQDILITSFDTGYITIPPVTFKSLCNNDTVLLETKPLLLYVNTVQVDTTKAIKDIKAPMQAPITFAEVLPWILLVLIIILITIAIIWIVRKRKKKQPLFSPKPKPEIPAYITALQNLNQLRNKKLWQNGKIKQYHTELTYELRLYLEKQYNISAIENTTNEIIDNINETTINKEAIEKLETCLSLADMVKFAKYEPLPIENDTSLNYAIDFVNETKIIPNSDNENKKGVNDVE